ncbi:triose-phosphate isomerase, partial [Candidatus Pelagibacter ubique]|nr:triose-phosphate isomerase [Candidatus Pelagibacter ubique]
VIRFSKSKEIKGGRLIYCPPNTLMSSFAKKFNNCQIGIGGQNCHESKDYGAHTGHVNSRMLKDIGAHFVIIGHSENREQGESDKLINLKIKSALDAKLKVIFCIGETLSEKRKKKTRSTLSKQIKIGLKNIKDKSKIFLAYEPVWAIGSGLIPKPQDLFKTVEFIKSKFKDKIPKVLYGGSVNPQNITILRKINNIDGFLIGGASQNSKKFIDIVKKTYS